MKCWEERARKEVAASCHQDTLALRDSIPEFIGLISEALSTTIDRTEARKLADRSENERVGKKHGSERSGSLNYTMDQLVYEYHILRQVICDVMEEDAELSAIEREVIVAAVEQAVNDAATSFSDALRDIQEKLTRAIAHDLRTPLTAARMGAQLILRRPNDADHCISVASRIVSNMNQLDTMIHDLLDASRVRAGAALSLELSECDMDVIARQVADEMNFIHGNRVVVRSQKPCVGNWDEKGLHRAIANLVTNAVKYGAEGTPITIEVAQEEKGVAVSVHNEGKPIPKDEVTILFQQFRRSRATIKKAGWGLGLTIVEGMAEAHHGHVHVESEEGKGTTFTLVLPWNSDFTRRPQSA